MNKNRGFTPLAVVLMLSGSLALTGCDDKQAQQGGQQMPAVGVVTVKTEPLQITTELPVWGSSWRPVRTRWIPLRQSVLNWRRWNRSSRRV